MFTKITLDNIVQKIKESGELPKLLEIKHYANILKTSGLYERQSCALNAIAKKLGYRKFNDIKNKLEDKGFTTELHFDLLGVFIDTFPKGLIIKTEVFINDTQENFSQSVEQFTPYLIISDNEIHIKLSDKNKTNLITFKIDADEISFSENTIKRFGTSSINEETVLNNLHVLCKEFDDFSKQNPNSIALTKTDENSFLFTMLWHTVLKPKAKNKYQAKIIIFDYINKDLDLQMDITFGEFNSKREAISYANSREIKAILRNKESIGFNAIVVYSKNKEWVIKDEDIVFRKLKKEKKIKMGKPLNVFDKEDVQTILNTIKKDGTTDEKYTIYDSDMEMFDYNLDALSLDIRNGFSFQIISYATKEY